MWHIRRAGICPYSRNITAWTLEGTLEVSQVNSNRWRKKESEITDETLILHPIPTSGILFFPHAKRFSDTIWVLYNLTQSRHYRPGESIRFHSWRTQSYKTAPSCPTSVASHKAGLSPVPLISQLYIEGSHGLLLRFDWNSRATHRTQKNVCL